MDLLCTLTHDSELHTITAPPLISTFYKPLLQTLSLLQLAVYSLAVPWKRLLTVEVLQPHALTSLLAGEYPATRSFLHSLPYRTAYQLSTPELD
jgi:hypothetical protein